MAIDDEIKLNLNAGKPLTGSQINVSAYGGTDFLEKYKETVEAAEEILSEAPTSNAPLPTHKYPLSDDEIKRYGTSVSFRALKINGAGLTSGSEENQTLTSTLGDIAGSLLNLDRTKPDAAPPAAIQPRTKDYAGTNIKLYLPVAFQQNDTFNIATPELGFGGASALDVASQGSGIVKGVGDASKRGISSILNLISGNLPTEAANLAATKLAGRVPVVGAELQTAASIAGAVTVNPNLRSAFRGVGLREFAFTFKFIARSKEEAEEVNRIVKEFRIRAYPETAGQVFEGTPTSAGYKYPDMFEIVITHQPSGKRVGSRIKPCFLRSIATSYNSSSMAFHDDGNPVEIDLSLSFVEEVTLNREDVNQEDGY